MQFTASKKENIFFFIFSAVIELVISSMQNKYQKDTQTNWQVNTKT